MIKIIWEYAVGKYSLGEYQSEASDTLTKTWWSFQDEHCVYNFEQGFGCKPEEITEEQCDIVAREFRRLATSVSMLNTFIDIYNGAVVNMPRLQINICVNDENGNFSNQLEQITIDDKILHIEVGFIDDFINCRRTEDGMTFSYEEKYLEIRCKLIATAVDIFWDVIEVPLPEAMKLINFLLDCNWSMPMGDLDLYNICNSGNRITEQHLKEALEKRIK